MPLSADVCVGPWPKAFFPLVRLITPVDPNEDVVQAEQRLTAFTQHIVPVLNEYLPK